MNTHQLLQERATPVVYHYTSIHSADRILRDGEIKLSSTTGVPGEAHYAPKGYPYFLSTTRSKTGDYHRWVGTGGVMFVLDGNWLSARYPVKPIDYWDRAWQHSPDRSREAEDRVFSRENAIPLDPVTSIHVLLKEQDDRRSARVRRLLIAAKRRGIKTYLYDDESAWRTQNTKRAVSPASIASKLSGPEHIMRGDRPVRGVGPTQYGRSELLNWIELIRKRPGQPLSKQADKLRYYIKYYDDTHRRLENDLFNAKKPDSNEYPLAVKLTDYLRKHKHTTKDLQRAIASKWSEQPRPSAVTEAESRTPASSQIRGALRKHGYRLLGSGQDATVWAKDSDHVIKIIMPAHGAGAGTEAQTFYQFYQFCQQHPQLDNLPRFVSIGNAHHAAFTADGKPYVMIGMERLQPIPQGSFAEAMVWMLSAMAPGGHRWEQILPYLRKPQHWAHFTDGMPVDQITKTIRNWTAEDTAKWGLLYTLMGLLYHTGRINRQDWDLHTENAMMRDGQTVVITDPWFNA